ncbi:MAG: hypothetical protein K940chlam6_00182 [Chlamydiae bacterium]|nr:hypothetical protein [Chlamydiota bacterium]
MSVVKAEINPNFKSFFDQCSKLPPEEIANRQLALDKTGYHPNENDRVFLATSEKFASITQKSMTLTQEYLSNFEGSNESERSFLELAQKIGQSFEFHKALLLKETQSHLTGLFVDKNVYFNVKHLKETYGTHQLTRIFQNIRALANKLNTDLENDFATKVMERAPKKTEALLLNVIQSYEDYALGEQDIEILNPERRMKSESSIISNYIPIAILICGFAYLYLRS